VNITKAMGRACLKAVGTAPSLCLNNSVYSWDVLEALEEMGWTTAPGNFFAYPDFTRPSLHADLAYLLAAEIAGVRGKR
jgi:hypothetical protein